MKPFIRIATVVDPSFFSYWNDERSVPIEYVYPEYVKQKDENELLVIVGNSIEIIGLFYTVEIDSEFDETPGRLIHFNLDLINPLELKFLYQDTFTDNHSVFSRDVLEYMKVTSTDRYNQLLALGFCN